MTAKTWKEVKAEWKKTGVPPWGKVGHGKFWEKNTSGYIERVCKSVS